MSSPLQTFYDNQARLATEDANLVQSLDPSRTVLLKDLLTDTSGDLRTNRLWLPWLERARFCARLAAAIRWLDGVKVTPQLRGWSQIACFFFQRPSQEADVSEHRMILSSEAAKSPALRRYTARFGAAPMAQYLHTQPRISTFLRSQSGSQYLRITPLSNVFSSRHESYVHSVGEQGVLDCTYLVQNGFIGYQIPDLMALLGVSPAVATDYLVRIVVHDLCHEFLPPTPRCVEGFHNAAALAAMDRTLPLVLYRNAWERMIHEECTNSAFCLNASRAMDAVRAEFTTLSPVQEAVLNVFQTWYLHPEAIRKRREYWGLLEDGDPDALAALIEAARADGFSIYTRFPDPP